MLTLPSSSHKPKHMDEALLPDININGVLAAAFNLHRIEEWETFLSRFHFEKSESRITTFNRI